MRARVHSILAILALVAFYYEGGLIGFFLAGAAGWVLGDIARQLDEAHAAEKRRQNK